MKFSKTIIDTDYHKFKSMFDDELSSKLDERVKIGEKPKVDKIIKEDN